MIAQTTSDNVSAGPLGLLIVLLMVVATVFLIRNMGSRIKNLPPEFPDDKPDDTAPEVPER